MLLDVWNLPKDSDNALQHTHVMRPKPNELREAKCALHVVGVAPHASFI